MNPNPEQVKSILRTVVATFGGIVAGFFAAKGWFTSDQVMSLITSETFLGLLTSGIVGVWGLFVHKQSNAVAVVAEIAKQPDSPVKGVVTEATPAGRALADSIPSSTVAPAGTIQATQIAAH